MHKKSLGMLVVLFSLSLLLGACAARQETMPDYTVGAPAMEEASEDVYESEYKGDDVESNGRYDGGLSGSANAIERMVIYNADLRIAVQDPEAAMASVIKMVEDAGGYVVSSQLYKTYTDRGNLPNANLMVRVPAGQLDSIMDAIKALTPNPKDDVISENVSGQDVTAEYTDLKSQLRNLEAAEEALVALMEEAKDPQDVLDIFDELTYYRGEIEIVKGRMKYLEESADLSAITIAIVAKESLQPLEIAGWEPKGTVKKAVEALIDAGQFVVDAAIWFGIFCVPFLIPLSLGGYLLVLIIRKSRAKRKAKKEALAEVTKEEDQA